MGRATGQDTTREAELHGQHGPPDGPGLLAGVHMHETGPSPTLSLSNALLRHTRKPRVHE